MIYCKSGEKILGMNVGTYRKNSIKLIINVWDKKFVAIGKIVFEWR